ncbi:MAG: UDP-N-acetylmuramate--L-alanine ligase [Chitinophagales bacterium]|nr:UDP-N-acetylmuramate--L-alanine ligase [Chitinophagales bacterium]
MSLTNISNIYFIGIGGIGMSALARYFNSQGKKVSGYDKTPSPLTNQLKLEGINITFDDSIETLDKDADLVVYTPAIPANHLQFNWYKNKNYQLHKRSVVLGAITQNKFTIAVAGSHGKTTVSSMIAHILNEAGGCTAFLGGIASNFGSNYIHTSDKYVVVEADEYDRSFMTLEPNIAVITAIDSDHLEIYGSLKNIENEFIAFTNKIVKGGTLFLNEKYLHIKNRLTNNFALKSYGYKTSNNAVLKEFKVENNEFHFSVAVEKENIENIKAKFGGVHNLENATVAIAVCKELGIADEKIKKALYTFKGIKRRFDIQLTNDDYVYIDDYAHHPEEIKALLNSIKVLYPTKNIVAIFQPHLFSRTQDLCADFAEQLSKADEVLLLPIYPARELPIEGVTSTIILNKVNAKRKRIVEKQDLLAVVKNLPKDSVVLTIGAGDIDRFVEPIKEILANE